MTEDMFVIFAGFTDGIASLQQFNYKGILKFIRIQQFVFFYQVEVK